MKVLMFVLAAVGVAACSNDDSDDISRNIENGQGELLPLNITISENPLRNANAPAKARTTRAAITTTETLTAFTLDYQYERGGELQTGQNSVVKTAGNWAAGTWPSDANDNTEVAWYAHTSGTFVSQSNPYLRFTVEELPTNQKDLLVAKAIGTRNTTGGNLSFTFDHVCTALRFYVKKSTNLNDYTLTVSNIKLCNVVKQGKYDFATAAWELDNSRSGYTLYSGTALTLGSDDYVALDPTDAPYFFMIPQTMTAWDTTSTIGDATTQTYLQLTCSITGATTFSGTAYIPFAATLDAGMLHDVKINIGKNSLFSNTNTKIIP